MEWARALRDTLKVALTPMSESLPYERFCYFSGVSPVPLGEDEDEIRRDCMVTLVREWECSDAKKWTRVLESLWGPAVQIIHALKDSQPVAMVQDYSLTLESLCGITDSSKNQYYCFSPANGSQISSRNKALLQQVV
ncbi:unnamed protein product [Natator depressus]